MLHKVYVIGIGPGHQEYLTPMAQKTAEMCDILIGGGRALRLFSSLQKEFVLLDKDLATVVRSIKSWQATKKVGVLVSGDPGYYSMMNYLSKHFDRAELEVIPGISSMQVAAARLGLSWFDARLYSFHGREISDIDTNQFTKAMILTDTKNTPQRIAGYLLASGAKNLKTVVLSDLTLPEEKVTETTLEGLQGMEPFPPAVMVIIND